MSSKMAYRSSNTCDICREHKVKDYCNECEQYFCQSCKMLHMRTKSNRHHTFKKVDAFRKDFEVPICEQHNEDYLYFCDRCEEPCCKVCIFTSHKGHNMSDITETVAKRKKLLASTWEVYVRKLDGARKSVDSMESSLHSYRQKVYKTIKEIESEGVKIKTEIDKTIADMIRELREKESEELQKVTGAVDKLKRQLERGIQLESHINKALKSKNDTSMLISLRRFQKDMASYIPEVVLPSDFSYMKGNSNIAYVQSLLGRVFFENGKQGQETPIEAKDDIKRLAKKYELWICQLCGSDRYIDHTEEHSFKTPRCCYGFMQKRGAAYR